MDSAAQIDRSSMGDRMVPAILLFMLALLLFDLMGLVIKYLSPSYSAVELSAYRNVFGLIPALIAIWFSASWHQQGRRIAIRQWRLAVLRGVVVIFAQLLFYLALGRIEFATVSTIGHSHALFMTAFAVPLLAEKVGLIRWLAVLIGFVGVVLVMGPGRETFTWDALLPLGAAALYALTGVTARMIDVSVPTALVNIYSAACAAAGGIVVALLWGGFSRIASWSDLFWITAMGLFGGCAVLTLIFSFRMTEQSNLAPFSYFGIPLAFLMGWVFFDEAPWRDLFPGALLIIIGGLLIIWRERRARRPEVPKQPEA